jgi:chorismate--pyruvate lyase
MWTTDLFSLNPDPNIQAWLTTPQNLAARCRLVCQTLTLHLIQQDFSTCSLSEKDQLDADTTDCFLREIILLGDGKPFSYGRVVIPLSTYQIYESDFIALGQRFIGETLLYTNPKTTRSQFEFAYLPIPIPGQANVDRWARRSRFQMNGQDPLLLTEVFFDNLLTIQNPAISKV